MSQKKYQRLLLYTCIWFLLLFLPGSTFAADKVILQLIGKNQFQFAGNYAAKELGFYQDAGMDVTIKEYEFGTDVTEKVISGRADFRVGRSSLILESMGGKPLPSWNTPSRMIRWIHTKRKFPLLAKCWRML